MMMKLTCLLILATMANIAATSNRTRRFLHTDKCDIKEYPSTVSITNMQTRGNSFRKTKYEFATGNLITMSWVLSYSHDVYFGNYSNWKVFAGTNYEFPGEKDDIRKIKRTVIHEKYHVDLALYELESPFTENDQIQPAKLPASYLVADECETFTVVGWGSSSDDIEALAYFLKEAVGKGDLLKCGKAKKISCNSPESESDKFCYDLEGTAQQCRMDYGLGVFCKDILVGVTTGLQSPANDECSSHGGEAYDIIHYKTWLRDTLEIDMDTTPAGHVNTKAKNYYKPSFSLSKRHTTAKFRAQFTSSSTTEETSEISYGQHIKPNCSIFLLLICLLLFL